MFTWWLDRSRRLGASLLGSLLAALLLVPGVPAQPLRLLLPTENDALFDGDGPAFYQYTDRYFKGRRSQPWEGGQYGFVRNLVETPGGIVFTRFHEGLDIKPVRRDAAGEPLDAVRAVDAGRVVYANRDARESNYGLYVVVEHWWHGSPYYTLYAHLGDVAVRPGQAVQPGARLGTLGYTGRGIDQRRAHVHFEINLLLNEAFEAWHQEQFPRDDNPHGIYNGLNMAGIDPAGLMLALQDEPGLTIPDFVARQQESFSLLLPNEGLPDLLRRYPWLVPVGRELAGLSWEIGLTRSGLPVRVEPSMRYVTAPRVGRVAPSSLGCAYQSNRWLEDGPDGRCQLSRTGARYAALLMLGGEPLERRVQDW